MKPLHTYVARAKSTALVSGTALLSLLGCVQAEPEVARAPSQTPYLGIETRLLDGDLVNFVVSMGATATQNDVAAYTECAAAQYALIRGFGFARHVRTTVSKEAGNWRGDAVYTISAALPDGIRTIDAEVIVANCHDARIPTV